MKIQALGSDPAADELALLINADAPQPAEAMLVDAGVYSRRDPQTGRVVGAIICGYANFLHAVLAERELSSTEAIKAGLANEFTAVVEWQRKALRLSRDLLAHLNQTTGDSYTSRPSMINPPWPPLRKGGERTSPLLGRGPRAARGDCC